MTTTTGMIYLPELREMLAENNVEQLRIFCSTLHPVRTVEFLEGLEPIEIWNVIKHAAPELCSELFIYLSQETQVEILTLAPRNEIAEFLPTIPSDDRINILRQVEKQTFGELLAILPPETRRDIQRLSVFPPDSCGSVMSTGFIRINAQMTVEETIHEIGKQTSDIETVYYLYVVDPKDHLVGIVSAKQLLAAFGKPQTIVSSLMRQDLITIDAMADVEQAASEIARYDLLAIPVVDEEQRLLGIITHDDVTDIVQKEVTEDVYRMAAITPMEEDYLTAPFVTVWRKRVFWLACLFFAELFTFTALSFFEAEISKLVVLAMFVPLCLSTGGNSGSQAATLIIRALALGQVKLRDWLRVLWHEATMGIALGGTLGLIAFTRGVLTPAATLAGADRWLLALTLCQAVAAICFFGTMIGCFLPLVFKRFGVDPAMASSPFVATFVDCTGIMIYFSIARITLISGTVLVQPVSLPTSTLYLSPAEPVASNRQQLIQECFRRFSDDKDILFSYLDAPKTANVAAKTSFPPLSPPVSPGMASQEAGADDMTSDMTSDMTGDIVFTVVFKSQACYERFEQSPQRRDFFTENDKLIREYRITKSEIEVLPEFAAH
ncbi:MAG: magnesium transporter [Planctomycetaceae bacterium]|nr:magnesium transporter [Planctomycetaceae bacterium]